MTNPIYQLFEEIDNADEQENMVWGLSKQKRTISQSASIFKSLSNKIRLFEVQSEKNKIKYNFAKTRKVRIKVSARELMNAPIYTSQRTTQSAVKKTNINFNGKYNKQSIHTFRVSKPRQIKKGHTRSVSSVENFQPSKFIISGSHQIINGRKALQELRPSNGNIFEQNELMNQLGYEKGYK